MVPFGFRIAWRRASWPTSRSPCSVKATTDGVVREPSALGTTVGWPPSTVAITELVVPRSIPTAFAIVESSRSDPPRSTVSGDRVGNCGRSMERVRQTAGYGYVRGSLHDQPDRPARGQAGQPLPLIGPAPPKAVDWQYCQYGRRRRALPLDTGQLRGDVEPLPQRSQG